MYLEIAPMLLVENVDEAIAWYMDVFKAKLQGTSPQNPPFEWASIQLGNIEMMFSEKKAAQRWYTDNVLIAKRPANFIAYIYIGNVNLLYNQIKNKVKVVMEPVDQPYGIREFAIQDPLGFTIIFAQIIK